MKHKCVIFGLGLSLFSFAFERELAAEPGRHECRTINAVLSEADRSEAILACEGAMIAKQELGRCGFHPRRSLRIGIVSVVYDGNGARQLGDYQPYLDRIRLLSKSAFRQLANSTFMDVSISETELYRSVAAHEAAHAIFEPYTRHLDLPINAQEYVAYAIQVMAFPADVRERMLNAGTDVAVNNLFHFSHFLLFADPQRFAVQAYRHFRAPGNSCDFLHAIVAQRVHFPPGTE